MVTNTQAIADMVETFPLLPAGCFPPRLENSEEDLNRPGVDKTHRALRRESAQADCGPAERGAGWYSGQVRRGVHVCPKTGAAEFGERLSGRLPGLGGLVAGGLYVRHHRGQQPSATTAVPIARTANSFQDSSHGCDMDMPDKVCPVCGEQCIKTAFDIPFETFLGFARQRCRPRPELLRRVSGAGPPPRH